ncbi:MAG: hypothetical protein WC648_05180, partial [Candidatus Paceibacterota bacterium]
KRKYYHSKPPRAEALNIGKRYLKVKGCPICHNLNPDKIVKLRCALYYCRVCGLEYDQESCD